MAHLPPRTNPTRADMPLAELARPLSAKAPPRSATISKYGDMITEAEARTRAMLSRQKNPNGNRRGATT